MGNAAGDSEHGIGLGIGKGQHSPARLDAQSLHTPAVTVESAKPPIAQDLAQPIRLGQWFHEGTSGTTWREKQLAKQAAEQKAREEEQEKLRRSLQNFLLR